jgi:hypothetical protein
MKMDRWVAIAGMAFAGAASIAGCSGGERSGPAEEEVGEAEQALTTCVTLQRGSGATVVDARLSGSQRSSNFGTQTILMASRSDASLIRFDLSGLPAGATVSSAVLHVSTNGVPGNGTVNVHNATAAWSEGTVTWNSFAQQFTAAAVASFTPPTKGTSSADITSLASAWVSGQTTNDGVYLDSTGTSAAVFVSSDFVPNGEADLSALRPSLDLCYVTPDHCAPNPCQNGATCTNSATGYTCACAPGYTGTNCQTLINNCAPNPCQNGGTCTNGVNSFTCACVPGYTGTTCQTLIDNCAPNPCQNGGTCTNGVNTFTCSCPAGYGGATCTTPTCPCAGSTSWQLGLSYGGSCSTDVVQYESFSTDGSGDFFIVQANVSSMTCFAADGDGYFDETSLPVTPAQLAACEADIAAATGCTYADPCAGNPCQNGGTCASDGDSSYVCTCPTGTAGHDCESTCPCASAWIWGFAISHPVIQCDSTSLDVILDGQGSGNFDLMVVGASPWTGSCIAADFFDYWGIFQSPASPDEVVACEQLIAAATGCAFVDPCTGSPCQNGGTCGTDGGDSYLCTCTGGYSGQNCEIPPS